MSTTKNLLVELFVEELPPKALKRLGEEFAARLHQELKRQALTNEQSAVTAYATPRRLAAHVSGVLAVAPDQEVVRKVMPVSVALDASGKPTAALRKAMAKLGRESLADRWPDAVEGSDRLYEDIDGKARALFLRSLAKGATLSTGLQNALDEALSSLPIPKVMSYQLADGWSNVQFVRPAHRLVALHGADVVPVRALGLEAGRDTLGHRFEASVEPIRIRDADHYARQLEEQGAVIAGFAHRRAEVVRQLQHAAGALGLKPIDDDALLDEVTGLVERPNVLRCQFEPEFLSVPPECLDPDDEGQPEVLSAARWPRRADEPVPRRQQHPARRSERGDPGQRARRAAAPGRREVLLRPGSQEDARVARGRPRQGRVPRQARLYG